MRVLRIIANTNLNSGGPIEGLLRSAEVMAAAGHHTEVLSLDAPGAPYLREFPLPIHACGTGRTGIKAYTPAMECWLKKERNRFDAAVVHGLWNWGVILGGRAARSAKLPYVVFTHGMLDPWFREQYPAKHLLKQVAWSALQGPILADAHRVLFTTEEEMQLAQGVFKGHPFRSQTVAYGAPEFPSGTEMQTKALETAVPGLQGRPYLLYLSRIHQKKGCDLLIEAFAKEVATAPPDLQLVMAGPDAHGLGDTLRTQADALGIGGRIHWPGMLKGEAKYGAFRNAEAFVLPSHQENFGIVVAEALSVGTPVLTTRKVNTWREVENGQAGFVAEDTIDGIRAVLRSWFTLPENQRGGMREAARMVYDRNFRIDAAGRDLAEVLGAAAAG
ncbi:glycosyltransferase [Mangrovicoccus ximenensis]|uniref:glycosyltransferase n=1 Tax=Mangrovicoccus ximenensis TaxID=1911570 RepID=UPI000D36A384|nr:glycosyltransferase [Mangrovicoccus ximenensis]